MRTPTPEPKSKRPLYGVALKHQQAREAKEAQAEAVKLMEFMADEGVFNEPDYALSETYPAPPVESEVNDVEAEPVDLAFEWRIPVSDAGFITVGAITNTVEDARLMVLSTLTVSCHDGSTRPLHPMERHWIATSEPVVASDAVRVTLSHDAALRENERLVRENADFAEAHTTLTQTMRDDGVELPSHDLSIAALLIHYHAVLSARSDIAFETRHAEIEKQKQILATATERAIASLQDAFYASGLAPLPPEPEPEPDWSGVRITITPDKLDAALIAARTPGAAIAVEAAFDVPTVGLSDLQRLLDENRAQGTMFGSDQMMAILESVKWLRAKAGV